MDRRFKCLFGSIVVSVALAACGPSSSRDDAQLKSIIDQNTMVVIDKNTQLSESTKKNLAAIGKMSGGCTAFHIGHGIVATAGHCIDTPKDAWQQTSCHSIDIIWGQTLDKQNAERSRCLQILDFRFDEQADYALLQVDPAPSSTIEIQGEIHELVSNSRAMVIGYPKDKSLSWSGTCEANWRSSAENQFFRHRCDTLPGNSGSPVMDAETSKVIGIHDGDADKQENYGSFLPPADQLLKLIEQVKRPSSKPQQLKFGPFANQLKQSLVNFTRQQAAALSFNLNTAVEDGYDKVLVIDGNGRSYEFTGSLQKQFDHLATPVSVIVVTDYSGTSNAVTLDSIVFE